MLNGCFKVSLVLSLALTAPLLAREHGESAEPTGSVVHVTRVAGSYEASGESIVHHLERTPGQESYTATYAAGQVIHKERTPAQDSYSVPYRYGNSGAEISNDSLSPND